MAQVGRPPKFSDPGQLWNCFEQWKEDLAPPTGVSTALSGDLPEVEGFCDYLGVWRDLLTEYEKKPEFSDTIKGIKNWIYYRKKQMAMAGKMNPAIFIFDAKNNFGYTDRTEVEESGEKKLIIETRQASDKSNARDDDPTTA